MMPYFIYRSWPFIVYYMIMRNNEGYMKKILNYKPYQTKFRKIELEFQPSQ